jgi:integrase
MFMLAYQMFLRGSELVRMKRSDVTFSSEMLGGSYAVVMKVHVDRLAKNDSERLGHDRFVAKRDTEEANYCLVDRMQKYLNSTSKHAVVDAPLFPTIDSKSLALNTPRHRLRHWLGLIGVADPSEYGFHSLRAGGATEAAQAGVPEAHIKLHGNWKSDAVRAYIRPNMKDKLEASSAIAK